MIDCYVMLSQAQSTIIDDLKSVSDMDKSTALIQNFQFPDKSRGRSEKSWEKHVI